MYNRHILINHRIFNKHIRESAVRLNKFQKILKNKKGINDMREIIHILSSTTLAAVQMYQIIKAIKERLNADKHR